MNNLELFNLMPKNKEPIFDEYYSNLLDETVITLSKDETNELMMRNERLISLIDAYNYLVFEKNKNISDEVVKDLIEDVIACLNYKNMNYSPFVQYFMVHNVSFGIYSRLSHSVKMTFLNFMLGKYIQERHFVYKSHGYSNIVLQVLSDNYSHKRKGSIGVRKVEKQLRERNVLHLKEIKNNIDDQAQATYYFLPDKGDKAEFKRHLSKYGIDYNFGVSEQDKLPDIFLKIGEEFYIIEHKNMKENGGGQDKQVVEILSFINNEESNPHAHYITYLDGIFSNKFVENATSKNKRQYDYILQIFQKHPNNYFVNTKTFEMLLDDILNN